MENKDCKTIAVVSGKGGSGKTMLTATIAKILDESKYSVLLIDADFGTAGLTYYLGLSEVSNISVGLTNLFSTKTKTALHHDKVIEKLKSYKNIDFIGVGDHRRYKLNGESDFFHEYFDDFITQIKSEARYDFIIVDCRGGVDDESLTVSSTADEIIIVAETDTTSFQATQYLVDTLYDYGVSDKLSGFFVNKVFDDPSLLIRNGAIGFKTRCLSSIPFDLDAIKSFLIGEIPKSSSVYTSQIWHGLRTIEVFSKIGNAPIKALDSKQFSIFSFKDRNINIGSYFISLGLSTLIASVLFGFMTLDFENKPIIYTLLISLFLSFTINSDSIKKHIGKMISRLLRL
ncbi:ParA family protein [Aeromonas veronii]|uniref:ParA family protein n=1 Tax=Aeromonas veronii TaxID=654 RepID=UPI0035BACE3A